MMKRNFNYTKALKELKIAYLGNFSQSAKMKYSYNNGTVTYCLYLAPWNMSGYNVCPFGQYCHNFCLNGSGVNKCEEIANGKELSRINISRVKKTKLFFENKQLFMELLIAEITRSYNYAKKHGMEFSVRLNGTSDLNPEIFVDNITGLNILQLFPNVQFYDYTKNPHHINLIKKYPNYDITFSYNGHNLNDCKKFLQEGGKVAVVFENQEYLPMKFMGYEVTDGNKYDMRYIDPNQSIIGLHYHKTGKNYETGKYLPPTEDFVIHDDNELVEWFA